MSNAHDDPQQDHFKPCLINIEPETVEALDKFARENGLTNRSVLVRLVLRQFVTEGRGDLSLRLCPKGGAHGAA